MAKTNKHIFDEICKYRNKTKDVLLITLLTMCTSSVAQNNNILITGTTVIPIHTLDIKIEKQKTKAKRTIITQMKVNIYPEKTDTTYQLEFKWSNTSRCVISINKEEIIQLNQNIKALNEIDMSDYTIGTKFQYVLKGRMIVYVEKTKLWGKQLYFMIPKAGLSNNPNYYDYETMTKIFGPLEDYFNKGNINEWPKEIIIR